MYQNKEEFNMKPTRDVCHYTCSKLSLLNILMVIIVLLLYMLLTGHKDPKIICQHFVGYVNTNLKTELNNVANPPDFSYDNLAGDSVNRSDDINEITSPLPSKNGKEILNNSSQDKPTGGKRKTKTKTKRRTKKRKTKRR